MVFAIAISLVAFSLFSLAVPLSSLIFLKASRISFKVLLNCDTLSLMALACSLSVSAMTDAFRAAIFSRAASSSTMVKLRSRNSFKISLASWSDWSLLMFPDCPLELLASRRMSVIEGAGVRLKINKSLGDERYSKIKPRRMVF